MRAIATYAASAFASLRVAVADRTNFLIQAAGMAVNNGFMLVLWFMFFSGFKQIGGWRMPDVALLIGLLAGVVGTAGVAFGGYRDLAASILRGDPDPYLTQPRLVLPRLLSHVSGVAAFGDVATGLVLLIAFARLGAADLPCLAFAFVCSLTIYLSAAVSFASLAFWARGARSFARDLTDFVITFSSWPGSIYSGPLKLVVYTVLPAGFVVLAPVALLRHPTLAQAGMLAAATAAYALIAIGLFSLGLRRYRRGEAPISAS